MKKRIKLNALAMLLGALLVVSFPRLFIRTWSGGAEEFIEMTGLALILFGQLLRVSARGYKAEHSDNSNSLVTSGPYSLVRNPMYLGIFTMGLGVVLMVGTRWALALFFAGFLIRYLYLFPAEERFLEKTFGNPYREYMKKVPRIIPSPAVLCARDVKEFLPLKIVWFRGELISLIPVLVLVLAIKYWGHNPFDTRYILFQSVNFIVIIAFFAMLIAALKDEKGTDKDNHKRKR